MIHHTPLPWSKRPNNKDVSFVIRSEYSSSHISAEAVRKTIANKHASVNRGVRLIPYIEGDVDFILHACNHYYEMVNVLNGLVCTLHGDALNTVVELLNRIDP